MARSGASIPRSVNPWFIVQLAYETYVRGCVPGCSHPPTVFARHLMLTPGEKNWRMNADQRDPEPHEAAERRPLLIEVMGPAAVGKTSLVRTLRSKDDRIRAGLDVPRTRWFPLLAGKVATLLPVWVLRYRRDRWFTWNELKSIAFLDAWYRASQRQTFPDALATVIDHGPVYRLARLREFGPSIVRSEPFQRWWRASLDGWLNALDIVVWLDAPDVILLRRVEERGHWFLSEDRPNADKREFLARYRRAFTETFGMGTGHEPRVIRLRSDQYSLTEMADEVLTALGSAEARSGSEGSHE